jgi:hypothetical protein
MGSRGCLSARRWNVTTPSRNCARNWPASAARSRKSAQDDALAQPYRLGVVALLFGAPLVALVGKPAM